MLYSQAQRTVLELLILLLHPLLTCALRFPTIGHASRVSSFMSFGALYLATEPARTGRQTAQIRSVLIAPSELDRSTGCKLSIVDFKIQTSTFKCLVPNTKSLSNSSLPHKFLPFHTQLWLLCHN